MYTKCSSKRSRICDWTIDMSFRSVRRQILALLASIVVSLTALPVVHGQQTIAYGAVVGLRGTPHLWIADERGVLHWGGDTRALSGKHVNWNNRTEVSLAQLRTFPIGDPWLSAGLLKDGDPIYLVKWESDWERPRLLHIQSIADVELFGIDGSNYGRFVLDKATWEARYGITAASLQRSRLPAAVTGGVPAPTPSPTATQSPTGSPAVYDAARVVQLYRSPRTFATRYVMERYNLESPHGATTQFYLGVLTWPIWALPNVYMMHMWATGGPESRHPLLNVDRFVSAYFDNPLPYVRAAKVWLEEYLANPCSKSAEARAWVRAVEEEGRPGTLSATLKAAVPTASWYTKLAVDAEFRVGEWEFYNNPNRYRCLT